MYHLMWVNTLLKVHAYKHYLAQEEINDIDVVGVYLKNGMAVHLFS